MTLTGVLLCLDNPTKVYFDCTIEVHVRENDGDKDSIVGVVGGSSTGSTPPVQSMSINKSLPHGVPLTFYTKIVSVAGQKGSGPYGTKALKDTNFQVQVSGFSD